MSVEVLVGTEDGDYLDTLHTLDEVQEENDLHEGVLKIYDLLHKETVYESPIDVHIPRTTKLDLPPLNWHHMDLPPKKVKFTNTGHTVILSAKWYEERPFLSGGPFLGNYVFSQLHFHWGVNNMEGSEHTISGVQHPLEMHAVFFKSCYLTQESALKKKDGMCVTAYIFKLQDEPNPAISILTDAIFHIRQPQRSVRLKSVPLCSFVKPFLNDYFLYAGSVNTSACVHYILWLISREPVGISIGQIDVFRTLLDSKDQPLQGNFRKVQPEDERPVYHANPSGQLHSTLTILKKDFDVKLSSRPQQVNKYPRSSKEYIPATGTTIYRAEIRHNNPFARPSRLNATESRTKCTMNTIVNIDPELMERIKKAKKQEQDYEVFG